MSGLHQKKLTKDMKLKHKGMEEISKWPLTADTFKAVDIEGNLI